MGSNLSFPTNLLVFCWRRRREEQVSTSPAVEQHPGGSHTQEYLPQLMMARKAALLGVLRAPHSCPTPVESQEGLVDQQTCSSASLHSLGMDFYPLGCVVLLWAVSPLPIPPQPPQSLIPNFQPCDTPDLQLYLQRGLIQSLSRCGGCETSLLGLGAAGRFPSPDQGVKSLPWGSAPQG